jgi:hypothetical protein
MVSHVCGHKECDKEAEHAIFCGESVEHATARFDVCDEHFKYLMDKNLITEPYIGVGE